jgi:hypothetical protein
MVGDRFAGVGQEKGSGRRFVMFHVTSCHAVIGIIFHRKALFHPRMVP